MERAPAFYWVLNFLGYYVLADSSGSLSGAKADHMVRFWPSLGAVLKSLYSH